ncbi:MAG TPA: hypothetical protein DEF47_21625 [Herpetosiphon sp.]|uniref:Lipoprotein n=1 Tax=Herpetosiphon aurantiacus (strain ATCC 23779 / DSM 785 / 114-95) TaxID=316274 RepID=A9AX08_HERA2|nr:hypothetical protein [Herpetosiphon sp.]ABX04816.1 hypothetical protein Haur_2176 [Herpetosiphon aurantiacus DSM 785]HBW52492.1 hypothetical protein [Herpetosiphon sp.]
MRRFGWMLLLILTVGCSVNSKNSQPQPIITETGEHVTVFPNYIAIVVPGYELTCLTDPVLSIQTADGWLPLEDFIMQPHYLDDKFNFVAGMCDEVGCNKINHEHPLAIGLPLYQHIGERKHLLDRTGEIKMLPAYRMVSPTQTVKLDITYFLDDACSKQQTYSTTIDLSN